MSAAEREKEKRVHRIERKEEREEIYAHFYFSKSANPIFVNAVDIFGI